MDSNPFRYLLPVSPENFVGRWALVKHIASDMKLIDGDSHAIIAGRRCGKSSLLRAIAFRLCQQESRNENYLIAMPILFDFKSESDTFKSVGEVFASIFREIYRCVNDEVFHSRSNNSNYRSIGTKAKWLSALATKPEMKFTDFEEGIEYIVDQITANNQRMLLILLLDEIDEALEHIWTQALFSQLRSIIYSSNIRSSIRLVVTGSQHFLDQVNTRGSPLWNTLKLHYLEPFDEIGLKELTTRSKDLPKEAETAIWKQSGGHPFLAQYLLHHLWDQGISLATSNSVNELAAKFSAEQIADIEGWARAIGAEGLEAFRILAAVNNWVGEHEIIRAINNPSLNVKRGLIALCYHGLAVHDHGWANYRRCGDIFKNWHDSYVSAFMASLNAQKTVKTQMTFESRKRNKKGLTWLHLSDWHQESRDVDWHQKSRDFDRKVVCDKLLEDIEKREAIDPDLSDIEFIVFSGDIASNGLSNEYEAAIERFLNPLLEISGVSYDKVFIVPGNHDLDRSMLDLLPVALLTTLESNKEVHNWLADLRRRERALDPFSAFASFVTAFTGQEQPDFANIRKWRINDSTIGLLGLNSCWMSGRNKDASGSIKDKNLLIVGEVQIHDPLKAISDDEIKIAVLHHPFDWLAEFDRNRIEGRLIQECDFILCGHQHKPNVNIISGNLGDCIIIPAGACYNRRTAEDPFYTNSYNFVHLDYRAGKGNVFLRRWSDISAKWVEDIESYKGGKYEFNIPHKIYP